MTATGRPANFPHLRSAPRANITDPATTVDKALTDAGVAALLLTVEVVLASVARTSLFLQYAVGVASWWLLGLLAVVSVGVALRALHLARTAERLLRRRSVAAHAEAIHAERLAVTVLGGWCLFLLVAG
jgi:hypothetical protein